MLYDLWSLNFLMVLCSHTWLKSIMYLQHCVVNPANIFNVRTMPYFQFVAPNSSDGAHYLVLLCVDTIS